MNLEGGDCRCFSSQQPCPRLRGAADHWGLMVGDGALAPLQCLQFQGTKVEPEDAERIKVSPETVSSKVHGPCAFSPESAGGQSLGAGHCEIGGFPGLAESQPHLWFACQGVSSANGRPRPSVRAWASWKTRLRRLSSGCSRRKGEGHSCHGGRANTTVHTVPQQFTVPVSLLRKILVPSGSTCVGASVLLNL